MNLHTEKAAPGAGNTESGTEQSTKLSVSHPGKCQILVYRERAGFRNCRT